MRRTVAALLVPALAALALAGCAQAPAQNAPPSNYAPYDPETNPYCGVFGTCEPYITHPYPIPSNH